MEKKQLHLEVRFYKHLCSCLAQNTVERTSLFVKYFDNSIEQSTSTPDPSSPSDPSNPVFKNKIENEVIGNTLQFGDNSNDIEHIRNYSSGTVTPDQTNTPVDSDHEEDDVEDDSL